MIPKIRDVKMAPLMKTRERRHFLLHLLKLFIREKRLISRGTCFRPGDKGGGVSGMYPALARHAFFGKHVVSERAKLYRSGETIIT